MTQPPAENHLADRRYVSVVLRLVLDQHGQMIHGEVVGDVNARPARFSGWSGLTRAVQAWHAGQAYDGADAPPTA